MTPITYIGRVHEIDRGTAYVTVRDNKLTGLTFQLQCDAEILTPCLARPDKNCNEEFLITIAALPPRKLTDEELAQINREVDEALPPF